MERKEGKRGETANAAREKGLKRQFPPIQILAGFIDVRNGKH
jgi:hypothetical protein